ncbi:hypothetical protein EDE04_6852 [Streptomyces sp. 2132.2]|nr:hypothetical protein EDE04_6852 [Streptomyces sp. 2132.2]
MRSHHTMAIKFIIVALWGSLLTALNFFVIDSYWVELASTALCCAGMAYCLSLTGRKSDS